jgi:hypothetical protein
MQTINIDGTSYKVKFNCDLLELAKLARKPYKQKKPKDIRKFPKDYAGTMSTGNYVRQFERLNRLIKTKYDNLNYSGTAQYDPTIPLLEEVSE